MTISLFVSALAASASEMSGKPFTVPCTWVDGRLFIDAKVNDKPAVFLIDTGDSSSTLTPEAAKRLGVDAVEPETPTIAVGAGGSQKLLSGRIGSLEVGGAMLKDFATDVMDLSPGLVADGSLGTEFLKRWPVTIDYQERTLTLGAVAPTPHDISLPMTLPNDVPYIAVHIDGAMAHLLIDTGDATTFRLGAPFADRYHLREIDRRRHDIVRANGVGGETQGVLVRAKNINFGLLEIKNIVGQLSLRNAGALADADDSDGSIGNEILSRYKVTLDYRALTCTFSISDPEDKTSGANSAEIGELPTVAGLIASAPGPEDFTVPFTTSEGRFLVSVELNGKPAVFAIDDATRVNVLDLATAKRLGISTVGPTALDSLAIGDTVLKQPTFYTVDLPKEFQVDGVLGTAFLNRYPILLNYKARTIAFGAVSPKPEDVVLPMTATKDGPTVTAIVDGAPARLAIDLGNPTAFALSASFVVRNHLQEKYPRKAESAKGHGKVQTHRIRARTVQLGALKIPNVLGEFAKDVSDGADGVIGYGLLSRFQVHFDYKGMTCTLSKDEPRAAGA